MLVKFLRSGLLLLRLAIMGRNMRFFVGYLAALVTLSFVHRWIFKPRLGIIGLWGRISLPFGIRAFIDFNSLILASQIWFGRCYELSDDFALRKGMVVVDVGAHTGIYSLKASKSVGDEGLIVAIEPHPTAYRALVRNIKINGLRNVKPVNAALGSSDGDSTLFFGPSSTYGTLTFPMSRRVSVKVLTLDKLYETLELPKIDLLKVDVEGFEIEVLKGASSLLRGHNIWRLVIETDVVPEAVSCVNFLGKEGYSVKLFYPFIQHVYPTIYAELAM